MTKSNRAHPIAFLQNSFNTILSHPVILFPFAIVAFLQLLILEILLFSNRYPLSIALGPLIRFNGEVFMHYPYNFVFITNWFQKAQIPLYVLFIVYFYGVAVSIIEAINLEKRVNLKSIFRKTLSTYVHLFIAGAISVTIMIVFSKLYDLVAARAMTIRSKSGIFFMIKKLVLDGAPFVNLGFAILVTTLFAFLIPIIVLERKKIFSAVVLNFKYLWGSFWFLLSVVLIPSLLYTPVLLLKLNGKFFNEFFIPEVWLIVLIVGIFVMLFIDTIVYTSITTYYLLRREAK